MITELRSVICPQDRDEFVADSVFDFVDAFSNNGRVISSRLFNIFHGNKKCTYPVLLLGYSSPLKVSNPADMPIMNTGILNMGWTYNMVVIGKGQMCRRKM